MIQNKEKLYALKQCVTSHYNFTGLTNEEVCAYVPHKLEFAGGPNILMDDGAFRILCESSQGISRTIDHIMSDALKWGTSSITARLTQRSYSGRSTVSPSFKIRDPSMEAQMP